MADPQTQTPREAALEMHASGLGYVSIARALGVSTIAVRRYVKPDFEDRMRRLSRDAKRRRTGTCRECGGVTHYNGAGGVSNLCWDCWTAPRTHCKRGHELTPENRAPVNGGRKTTCRICRNAYMRDYLRNRRLAARGPDA